MVKTLSLFFTLIRSFRKFRGYNLIQKLIILPLIHVGWVDSYRVLYVNARRVNTLCLGFAPVSADVHPSGN